MIINKPKIIFLASNFDKGGMEKVACNITNLLSDNYSIFFVVFKVSDKSYYKEIENVVHFQLIDLNAYEPPSRGIRFLRDKIISEIKGGYKLVKILHSIQPQFIISVDPHGIFWANILVSHQKTTIYMWWHNTISLYSSQKSWIWKKFIFKKFNKHIVLNQAMKQELKTEFPQADVTCIYNAININGHNFIAKGSNFIYVGRLYNNQKRLDRLFKALALLNRDDWRLQIIGEGQDRQFLTNLANELKINNKIIWSGWIKNPWQTINSASFGVLSSDYEGSPMVVTESIYHGLPYICMDCPVGLREIIKEGVNGTIVSLTKNEESNIERLSVTLLKAIKGEIKIGTQQAMRESIARFMPQEVFKEWLRLFKKPNI